jgi:hypothetical protein
MEEYLSFEIKNNKSLNKKFLCITYLKENFNPEVGMMYDMINAYIQYIKENKDVIVILNLKNLNNWDKKLAWEGASELKKSEKIFIENINRVFIITNNNLINNFVNIVLKVVGNKIQTDFINDINSVIETLKK